MIRMIRLLAIPFFLLSCAPPPLEVTYVANEGFLLASGSRKVLVDALFSPDESQDLVYAIPTEESLAGMIAGEGRFSEVDAVLVTHAHWDHFARRDVAAFLERHTGSTLIATQEAADQIRGEAGASTALLRRIDHVDLEPGQSTRREIDGIGIKIFRTQHSRNNPIQNQMYLIDLGGYRIFHEGDAARETATFRDLGLEKERIDVAFLHSWYIRVEEGREIIRKYLKPRHVVLMHIGPAWLESTREQVQEILSTDGEGLPGVSIPGESMETQEFRAGPGGSRPS